MKKPLPRVMLSGSEASEVTTLGLTEADASLSLSLTWPDPFFYSMLNCFQKV